MKNIVITGFMASGKSTVSEILSKITGMEYIDTDKMISDEADMSINNIFEKYGEAYFRQLESDVSKRLSSCENIIISTGGGFVLCKENIDNLRDNGIIYLLNADFSVIRKRIGTAKDSRPLMRQSTILQIRERYEQRKKYYDNCDYRINIDNKKSPFAIANEIYEIHKKFQ